MMDYFGYIRAIRVSDLSSHARFTSIMIASHYNFKDNKPAWPSIETLAKETGLSKSSVKRAIKELKEAGFLEVKRVYDGSNRYHPRLPQSSPWGQTELLNTHINTHLNTNNKSSNEDLVISNISIQEEVIDIEDNDSANFSLAEVKAIAAPWDGDWR
jgi:biotin operon repressor